MVTGIAGMGNLKEVGGVGGKALLYFEIVTTISLILSMLIGNLVPTGTGFNANPSASDSAAVTTYAGQQRRKPLLTFCCR